MAALCRSCLGGFALGGLVSPVFSLPAAAATPPSGVAVAVVQQAEANGRVLRQDAPVFSGDAIVTGPIGQAQVKFRDNTKLVVGPNSRLVIDAFIYSGNNTARKLSINALKGAFRFISGNSRHDAYNITTPTATIGVRGTQIDVNVSKGVVIYSGAAEVCRRGSGSRNCVTIRGGCSLATFEPSHRRQEGPFDRRPQPDAPEEFHLRRRSASAASRIPGKHGELGILRASCRDRPVARRRNRRRSWANAAAAEAAALTPPMRLSSAASSPDTGRHHWPDHHRPDHHRPNLHSRGWHWDPPHGRPHLPAPVHAGLPGHFDPPGRHGADDGGDPRRHGLPPIRWRNGRPLPNPSDWTNRDWRGARPSDGRGSEGASAYFDIGDARSNWRRDRNGDRRGGGDGGYNSNDGRGDGWAPDGRDRRRNGGRNTWRDNARHHAENSSHGSGGRHDGGHRGGRGGRGHGGDHGGGVIAVAAWFSQQWRSQQWRP